MQAQAKLSLEGYAYYIANERAKKPDLFIVRGLYERAIAEAARRRFIGEAGAEEALRSFWGGYCDVLVRFYVPLAELNTRAYCHEVADTSGTRTGRE